MVDFERLKNNIIDMLVEQQLKLGYISESVALYYPLESLQDLLNVAMDENSIQAVLAQFCQRVIETFGEVTFSNKNERFCLRIPPKGGAYVHELLTKQKYDKYCFLKDFLNEIVKHNVDITALKQVFEHYSDCVAVERLSDSDFDYLIYFEDEMIDDYRYCIKYEGEHATYHRFTKQDYVKLYL